MRHVSPKHPHREPLRGRYLGLVGVGVAGVADVMKPSWSVSSIPHRMFGSAMSECADPRALNSTKIDTRLNKKSGSARVTKPSLVEPHLNTHKSYKSSRLCSCGGGRRIRADRSAQLCSRKLCRWVPVGVHLPHLCTEPCLPPTTYVSRIVCRMRISTRHLCTPDARERVSTLRRCGNEMRLCLERERAPRVHVRTHVRTVLLLQLCPEAPRTRVFGRGVDGARKVVPCEG